MPIKRDLSNSDTCNFCRVPETGRHILLDCIFAKELWNMFGIVYPIDVTILDIISGHIDGLPKDTNLFWNILLSNILWQIWKCKNEERYQGKQRGLTNFFRKLTYFKIYLQVQATMLIEREKLRRFLHDGYQWHRTLDDLQVFTHACNRLTKEIKEKGHARKEELFMLMHIQEHKRIVWMEGPLGWTAWVDTPYDILG